MGLGGTGRRISARPGTTSASPRRTGLPILLSPRSSGSSGSLANWRPGSPTSPARHAISREPTCSRIINARKGTDSHLGPDSILRFCFSRLQSGRRDAFGAWSSHSAPEVTGTWAGCPTKTGISLLNGAARAFCGLAERPGPNPKVGTCLHRDSMGFISTFKANHCSACVQGPRTLPAPRFIHNMRVASTWGLQNGWSSRRKKPGPCPGVACDLVGLTERAVLLAVPDGHVQHQAQGCPAESHVSFA